MCSSVLSHVHICIFFYIWPCVEPNVHSFPYVCIKSTQTCHSLAFSVRLCVLRKPLRKIFLRAKTLLARKLMQGKRRKKEKSITQLRSNCIRLNILFDCFSYEQIKNKMAETIWWIDPYLLSQRKMHGQTPLPARRKLRKHQAQIDFHSLFSPRSFSFHFFCFRVFFSLSQYQGQLQENYAC